MQPANIRWLRRPRPIKRHYACDKCKTTHSNYVDPDLCVVLHMCRYKTPSGTQRVVEREMILQ